MIAENKIPASTSTRIIDGLNSREESREATQGSRFRSRKPKAPATKETDRFVLNLYEALKENEKILDCGAFKKNCSQRGGKSILDALDPKTESTERGAHRPSFSALL